MTFTFECPEGHPLEAEENQVGDTCRCPECGTLFIVPDPDSDEPTASAETEQPIVVRVGDAAETPAAEKIDVSRKQTPELLHIPCPQGHMLEAPPDMLGEYVACPFCGSEFSLEEKNSREFQELAELRRKIQEHRVSKFWLQLTLVIAAFVVLGLLGLIMSSMY